MARRNMAIVKSKPGYGFEYLDVGIPEMGPRDVLIKVKVGAICGSDFNFYTWANKAYCESFCKKFPLTIGHEFSGVVEVIGNAVTFVKLGDRVVCDSHIPCGHCRQCQIGNGHLCLNVGLFGSNRDGCFAQYTMAPENCVRVIPDELSFDYAALLEPFGVIIRSVLESDISGSNVAVTGCGPIGLFALALSKYIGAHRIWAIDINDYRLSTAKDMGADYLINSKEQPDFSRIIKEQTVDGVDVFLECSGNVVAVNEALKSVCRHSKFCMIGQAKQDLIIPDPYKSLTSSEMTMKGNWGRSMFATYEKAERFMLDKAVDLDKFITHRYSMKDCNDAFEMAMSGKGIKVLLYPEEG